VQACLHQQAATGNGLHRTNPSTKKRHEPAPKLLRAIPPISKVRHAFRIINLQDLALRDPRGGSPRARAAGRSSTTSDVGVSSSTTAPLPSTTPPTGAKVIATPPRRGATQPFNHGATARHNPADSLHRTTTRHNPADSLHPHYDAPQPCRPTPQRHRAPQLRRPTPPPRRTAPRRRAPEPAKRAQGGARRAQAEGRARGPSISVPPRGHLIPPQLARLVEPDVDSPTLARSRGPLPRKVGAIRRRLRRRAFSSGARAGGR
jgi:hypothetical protein